MANTVGYTATGHGGQAFVRPADNAFLSIFDWEQDPQVWDKRFVKKYGNLLGILDTMRLVGAVDRQPIRNTKITMFEDANQERPLRLDTSISTTDESEEFTVEVSHYDYDDNGNGTLQQGDTFFVPGKYITDSAVSNRTNAQAWVKSVSAETAGTIAETFTCEFFSNTVAITTEIPATAELILGGNVKARGTGQPGGRSKGSLAREFYSNLLKRSQEIEGGVQGTATYRDMIEDAWEVTESMSRKGLSGYWMKQLEEMEFQFEADKDKQVWMGNYNSNPALTETAKLGGSNVVLSGDGILPHLDSRAQQYPYDTEFAMNQFDEMGRLLQGQGVLAQDVLLIIGNELNRTMENSSIEWVKSYSAGTDFRVDETMGSLETRFSMWDKGGIRFHKRPMYSWSNPFTYGKDSTFANMGFAVPVSNNIKTTVDGQNLTMNNIEINHFSGNGEQRSAIIGDVFGMNGMGQPILDEYDRGARYLLSEFMTIVASANQLIKIYKR